MTQIRDNKFKWTISRLTRKEIQDAIDSEYWQNLRRGMKGITTERKIRRLMQYYGVYGRSGIGVGGEVRIVRVRVDNYLNALLRGGQLRKIDNETLEIVR